MHYLPEEKHTEPVEYGREKYGEEIDFNKLLSSVLLPKFFPFGKYSYTFMHASIIEFFAPLSIIRKITGTGTSKVTSVTFEVPLPVFFLTKDKEPKNSTIQACIKVQEHLPKGGTLATTHLTVVC